MGRRTFYYFGQYPFLEEGTKAGHFPSVQIPKSLNVILQPTQAEFEPMKGPSTFKVASIHRSSECLRTQKNFPKLSLIFALFFLI